MTLSKFSIKTIIYSLIFVSVAVFSFGPVASLSINKAHATGMPVVDVLGSATKWAIRALEKVWDAAKWVAEKAWDVARDSFNAVAKWVKDNIKDILLGAAIRVAADFLSRVLKKLLDNRKIKSYLYYADFLARSVYALEYIDKNYSDVSFDKYFENANLILYVNNVERDSQPFSSTIGKSKTFNIDSGLADGKYSAQTVLVLGNGQCLQSNSVNFTVGNGGGDSYYPAASSLCTNRSQYGSVTLKNNSTSGQASFQADISTSRDNRSSMVILSLINSSEELYSNVTEGSTFYQYVKNQTVLNPKCKTSNLSPADPNYYSRLLESQGPDCIPQYTMAVARDAAFSALNESQIAAEREIESGGGFQSTRSCGTVETKDVFRTDTVPVMGNISVPTSQGTTREVQTTVGYEDVEVQTGTKVDVVGSGFSLVCSAINNPASQTSVMIQELTNQLLGLNLNTVGNAQNSATLQNFFTTVVSVSLNKLIFGDSQADEANGTVDWVGGKLGLRTDNGSVEVDTSLIPNGLDTRPDGPDGDAGNLYLGRERDIQQVQDYWTDMCTERLPFLFAIKDGKAPNITPSNPTGSFYSISSEDLMQKNQIVKYKTTLVNFLGTNESDIKDNLKGDRSDRQEAWENIVRQGKDLLLNFAGKSTPDGDVGTNEIRVFWSPRKIADTFYGKQKTIEELISTTVPFVNHIQRGSSHESDLVFYYFYLWQAIDSTSKINEDLIYLSNGGYEYSQPNITLGRKYSMSVAGIPTTLNLDEVASWSPSVWPFFLDPQSGKGYEFTYLGQSEVGLESSNQSNSAVASGNADNSVNNEFQNSLFSIAETPYPEDDDIPDGTGGTGIPGGGGTLPEKKYFDDYYAKYRVDVEPNGTGAIPGTGKLIDVNNNRTSYGIRVYSINGNLIAMRDDVNGEGGERMWKLDKNLTVTIDSRGNITFNSNDLRLAKGEKRAVIQYTDRNGQVRVYSAYELEKQKPCAQQPFGPPLDIENIAAKVYYSKNISPTLWKWIQAVAFVKNGNQ